MPPKCGKQLEQRKQRKQFVDNIIIMLSNQPTHIDEGFEHEALNEMYIINNPLRMGNFPCISFLYAHQNSNHATNFIYTKIITNVYVISV